MDDSAKRLDQGGRGGEEREKERASFENDDGNSIQGNEVKQESQ